MKASEVLRRYAEGEINFQRVNLRGQSFQGENLSGADFSEADLRSTNFTGATLIGVNFTDAKCGLQKRWATLLVIFSWLLAGISGFLSVLMGAVVTLIFDPSSTEDQIIGWVSLIVLVLFLIVVMRHGIGAGAGVGAVAVAGVLNEAEQKNLADAATEIQQLLEQLSKNHPTSKNKEKMVIVGEAVDRIEQNPTLKAKVINALKAGGTEAFKEAVNHPLVNILLASIEGWQDS